MRSWIFAVCVLLGASVMSAPASAEVQMRAALLEIAHDRPIPLSRLDIPVGDEGFAGGQQALADNNTTGRFLGQTYELIEVRTDRDGLDQAMTEIAGQGIAVVIVVPVDPSATVVPVLVNTTGESLTAVTSIVIWLATASVS